jgi:flagellin-specific chaperone FliS
VTSQYFLTIFITFLETFRTAALTGHRRKKGLMMHMLTSNPAAAYRRVELDARIEAAGKADLTRICLEEAVAALGQALAALERQPGRVPHEPLSRAQVIALWLAGSVDQSHPLRASLVQFYGGEAAAIRRCLTVPDAHTIEQVRCDFAELLEAGRQA